MEPREEAGEFETHLTVSVTEPAEVDRLARWGAERGLTCVHIVLDRGACPSQPMLTWRGDGMLAAQHQRATDLAAELTSQGYAVSRIKIEASPANPSVPQTPADTKREPPGRYFEHHVKLLLAPGTDEAPLLAMAERHAAHLSRNARRRRDDGSTERFVTQRCWGVGREEARGRLEALVAALAPLGYPVLSVEQEYVVFDSNAEVDAGWLREGP